jgi:uncharacterized membrane protein
MKTQLHQKQLDDMKNNPDNYKWGIFYYNTNDTRVIVPKRNAHMGWTLNFANGYSYILVIAIIMFGYFIGKALS